MHCHVVAWVGIENEAGTFWGKGKCEWAVFFFLLEKSQGKSSMGTDLGAEHERAERVGSWPMQL